MYPSFLGMLAHFASLAAALILFRALPEPFCVYDSTVPIFLSVAVIFTLYCSQSEVLLLCACRQTSETSVDQQDMYAAHTTFLLLQVLDADSLPASHLRMWFNNYSSCC